MKKIFNFVKANYFRLLMLIFAAIVAASSICVAFSVAGIEKNTKKQGQRYPMRIHIE